MLVGHKIVSDSNKAIAIRNGNSNERKIEDSRTPLLHHFFSPFRMHYGFIPHESQFIHWMENMLRAYTHTYHIPAKMHHLHHIFYAKRKSNGLVHAFHIEGVIPHNTRSHFRKIWIIIAKKCDSSKTMTLLFDLARILLLMKQFSIAINETLFFFIAYKKQFVTIQLTRFC